jgi:hypothetical protein
MIAGLMGAEDRLTYTPGGLRIMTPEKQVVFAWIDQHRARLSDYHQVIWKMPA